jgi:hypothetical protein
MTNKRPQGLRWVVREWADRAKQQTGQPSASEAEELKSLWEKRKELGVLSDYIPGNYGLKWKRPDPDWVSWRSIAECFGEYHTALVERDNREAPGMAALRMQGT